MDDGGDVVGDGGKLEKKQNATVVGAISAGGRSVVYQFISFYFRAPLKLFRPAQFDYFHYLREVLRGEVPKLRVKTPLVNETSFLSQLSYLYEASSLGVLSKSVNKFGWRVIPDRILPPVVLNSVTGLVLYSTYLSSLKRYSNQLGTNDDDPRRSISVWMIFKSGLQAGIAQSVVSTPIDSIYRQSTRAEIIQSLEKFTNLWSFGYHKLKQIGFPQCYNGYLLNLVKESVGFAVYFTSFEVIRSSVCNLVIDVINSYKLLKYNIANFDLTGSEENKNNLKLLSQNEVKWISRLFVFVGGVTAAFLLQVIQYPFIKIQEMHYSRSQSFRQLHKSSASYGLKNKYSTQFKTNFNIQYHTYMDTIYHIKFIHDNTHNLTKWFYKGFARRTLSIIPGTAAGLMLLDYLRASLEMSAVQKRILSL